MIDIIILLLIFGYCIYLIVHYYQQKQQNQGCHGICSGCQGCTHTHSIVDDFYEDQKRSQNNG